MSSQNVLLDTPDAIGADDQEPAEDPVHELALRGQRTLRLIRSGADDLLEVRAATGLLELRVRITDDGPVLQMESVRISLKASESVDVTCRNFSVNATESLDLQSEGGMKLSGAADVRVDATGEVHVNGKMIFLN